MKFRSIVTRALLAALLTGSLAVSDVFAQRGGRGGGDGDRGDRGSARSSGGGGGGGGSSFRGGGGSSGRGGSAGPSMRSGGGGSGGPSIRSGGGGSGGPSMRSGGGASAGPSIRSGGGGSGGPSMRSGDGGSGGPSFRSGGGASGGPSMRSGGGASAGPSMRSGGGGSAFQGGGDARSAIGRGAPSARPSFQQQSDGDASARRSFQRGDASGEGRSIQGNPWLGSPAQGDSAGARSRPAQRPAFTQGSGESGTARQDGFSRGQYQVERPSEDRVRQFLGDGRGGDRSTREGDATRFGQDDAQRRSFNRRDYPGRDGVSGRDLEDGRRGTLQERLDQQRYGVTDSSRRDGTRRGDGERRDWDGRSGDGRDWASRSGDWDGRRGDWDGRRGDWDGRRGDWDGRRGDWDGRRGDWDGRRGDRSRWEGSARNVRNYWQNRWRGWDVIPFYAGWWGPQWNHWGIVSTRYNRPYYWWGWQTGPRLGTWFSFGWNQPYYWDYGPGAYIYPHNNVIYVNGEWYAPAPVYYERTVTLVEQAPELTPEVVQQLEWLPLGVFALAREDGTHTDLLVQLAVTEEGVVGGNVFNQSTGETHQVRGTVEEDTQRTVWGFTDASGQQVVMETSIYNLTRPETTALIHYGPERMEVGQLVRLEAPPEAGQQQTSARVNEPLPAP